MGKALLPAFTFKKTTTHRFNGLESGRCSPLPGCPLLFTVLFPEKLKAKIGEPPLHARMESAETKNAGLLLCQLQFEFR
jgi:hypothetical protein